MAVYVFRIQGAKRNALYRENRTPGLIRLTEAAAA